MFNQKVGYNGNVNLRAAGVKVDYEESHIEEFVKCKNDIKYFIENYCKIVSLDKGVVGFSLYDYQKRMVDTIENNRFTIVLWGRQQGKCVGKDTKYKVKNSKTGVEMEVTAEEFHNLTKPNDKTL